MIPTHNRAHLIRRAIDSALANLGTDDEVIVVDDASTDHTAELLADYDPRVRCVTVAHCGAGGARNVGVKLASRDLVAFLDSDDQWTRDKLQLQRTVLSRRPELLFCASNFSACSEDGESIPGFLRYWHKDQRPWTEILSDASWYSELDALPDGRADFRVHYGSFYELELISDYLATSTVVVRREAAGDALCFADDLVISEDKQCFARLAGRGPGAYLDCDTSIQWSHGGPRVSETTPYALATSKLRIIERVWAKDPSFVASHQQLLDDVMRAQYLKRARWLLVRGRVDEARADLSHVRGAPWPERLCAQLPATFVLTALACRRWLNARAQPDTRSA